MNSPGSRTSAEDVMALNMDSILRVAPFYLNIFFFETKISNFGKKTLDNEP